MKLNFLKKTIAFSLASIMTISVVGCGNTTQKETEESKASVETATSAQASETVQEEEFSYPIDTDETLTWMVPMESNTSSIVDNLGETEFAKVLQEKTGVKIEFICPTGNYREQVNLALASGELPDIIDEELWVSFPGGPEKAIQDGYIIPLNDLMEYAPNFNAYIADKEEYQKWLKADDGTIYAMPYITTVSSGGLMIRKDWLDDLGLEVPETIDEWYTALKAFKEEKGATAPLTLNTYAFTVGGMIGAWDLLFNWYVDDGEVHHGAYEDSYKDFLTTMNQWYKEGLFDNNFAVNDGATIQAQMLDGTSGAVFGGLAGALGKYNQAMEETDPEYLLVAAPFPVLEKGQKPEFAQKLAEVSTKRTAITTSCKNPELAMRVIDFLYSEEGQLLMNFGTEGVSYTMENGVPTFTDEILNNPDGLTIAQALSNYAKPYLAYWGIQDVRAYEQTLTTDVMREALKIWDDTNAVEHVVPPLFPTDEEAEREAEILTAVNTYINEMQIKFITGAESLDNFDQYKENLKEMGMEELIAIKNAGYERYQNR